jgi:hypothetical protein
MQILQMADWRLPSLWVNQYFSSLALLSITNRTYPNIYQYFVNLSKNTTKRKKCVLTWFGVFILRNECVGPISRSKNYIRPKGRNPPNVPQLRPIKNFWAILKKKTYCNNYRPKGVKCLMTMIRKESIETTRIRKAMKDVSANV